MPELRRLPISAIIALATFGGSVQAAPWRYCLAEAPEQHAVYMSPPFADADSMESTEAQFARALDRDAVEHGPVQCPLGDARSIGAMKVQAVQYNKANGNKVIQLNWRP